MLHAKGVAEYVAAARQTKTLHPQAVFLLVGPSDPNNPSAVPVAQLEAWSAAGAVRYCGRRDDIKDLLALSDLVVFPSYYREGIPKVLLEAAAMAKPIITTDIPGCRDVVTHNRTGLLVPPRDVPHLSEAISTLLLDQQLRTRLGAAARIRITTRFDISYVVDKTASKYSELLGTRRKL
jgi:glycosyltransferase involved in cell wall biosynthesis